MRPDQPLVAINARAAIRAQIGGVERLAREMAMRLPALRPDRYRVIAPPRGLAHRAGHAWEQTLLPIQTGRASVLYSPANLAPLRHPRNVVVIHDVAALRHPEAYSLPFVEYHRRLLPRLVRGALQLVTVSEFSRRELVEMVGASPERVAVIPEGVDERFLADHDSMAVRARYGLAGPYALAVGTVSTRKNLGALAPAARALATSGIELVIAGSDRGYLRGADPGLRRLGYVDEELLPGLYAGALALAMPSRYEGFGLPCLEAMACGTPVVAASRAALPETCGDAALFVDPADGDSFAQAMVAAATDEPLRSRLIGAGRSRASMFTWARTARLTDELIDSLVRSD